MKTKRLSKYLWLALSMPLVGSVALAQNVNEPETSLAGPPMLGGLGHAAQSDSNTQQHKRVEGKKNLYLSQIKALEPNGSEALEQDAVCQKVYKRYTHGHFRRIKVAYASMENPSERQVKVYFENKWFYLDNFLTGTKGIAMAKFMRPKRKAQSPIASIIFRLDQHFENPSVSLVMDLNPKLRCEISTRSN